MCLCACAPAGANGPVIVDDFNGPTALITAEGQPVPPGEPLGDDERIAVPQRRHRLVGRTRRCDRLGGVPHGIVERDFDHVDVSVMLRVDDLVTTDRTPAQDYDGAHIWVRYQSEFASCTQ